MRRRSSRFGTRARLAGASCGSTRRVAPPSPDCRGCRSPPQPVIKSAQLTSEHSIAIPARFDLKPHSVRLMPAMFAECAVCEAGAVVGQRAVRLKNLRSLDPAAAYWCSVIYFCPVI